VDAIWPVREHEHAHNRIEKAFVRINAGAANQTDLPLQIVRTYEDWSLVPVKLITSGFPQSVFLDSGYPLATLYVWPAPSSLYEIHLLLLNPLIRIADVSTDINLPDEYQDAIFWNLCKRLLNSYRKPKDPEIDQQAAIALNTVRNTNFQLPVLQMPRELTTAGTTVSIRTAITDGKASPAGWQPLRYP
jgi:hypothetical protein